jgi:hypothetical protein
MGYLLTLIHKTQISMKFRRQLRRYSKFGSITSLTESELSLDLYQYLRDLQATVPDCLKKAAPMPHPPIVRDLL